MKNRKDFFYSVEGILKMVDYTAHSVIVNDIMELIEQAYQEGYEEAEDFAAREAAGEDI